MLDPFSGSNRNVIILNKRDLGDRSRIMKKFYVWK